MSYKEIEGDLIELALEGKFDVITHGCNCFNKQKSGIAKQMVRVFYTDKYFMERNNDGDGEFDNNIFKLGQIDAQVFQINEDKTAWSPLFNSYSESPRVKDLRVINSYTQYRYGKLGDGGLYLDYDALTLCFRKINKVYAGKIIGIPYVIGCGLAGGDKNKVIEIIKRELFDMDVIMVKKI